MIKGSGSLLTSSRHCFCMVLPPPAGLPLASYQGQVQHRGTQRAPNTVILFTVHLFTFHGWIHFLNGIIQQLIQTEITLSDDSSILENDFRFKIANNLST